MKLITLIQIKLILATGILTLAGCASTNTSPGQGSAPQPVEVWANASLKQQTDSGAITLQEAEFQFAKDQGACDMEAFKIAIPAPSCHVMPSQDCSGLSGMALGFCQGQNSSNRPKCDYSAVNAAHSSRKMIFRACMTSKGYHLK